MKKIYWSKILITLLIGLPLLYTLLGFLVAPALLRGILEGRVAAAIGHDIAVSKIRVNPLEFTVEAENVAINDPDRGPVLSLRRFFMDVEVSSLFLDTNVVAQVILEQPWINIVLAEDGQLNLTRLVPPASSAPEPQKNNPPKPVLIESIAIHEASILFEDLNSEHPVRHIFEPINIELEQVSTRINALGLSEISILTEDGERALINSQFSLEPLRLRSTIDIADLNLKRLNPHLATPELPRVEHGRLNVSGRLIMDHGKDAPGLLYFQGNIQMADVGLSDGHKNPLIGFTGLEIPAIDLSLTDSVVAVERIALTGLWIETGLDDQGDLPPVLMAGRNPRQSDQDNAQSVASLKFHLGEFILKDGYIKFDDRSIQPPVHLELSELQARVGNVTNLADAVTDLTLDTVVNSTQQEHRSGRSIVRYRFCRSCARNFSTREVIPN